MLVTMSVVVVVTVGPEAQESDASAITNKTYRGRHTLFK